MELEKDQIQRFTRALKNFSEYDFTEYSEKSLSRRLAKILHDYGMDMGIMISKISEDREYLEKIVKEVEEDVRSKEDKGYKEGSQYEGHQGDVHWKA